MPSLMIVDDEFIFRRGLRHMINEMNSDWEIVGEAEDGKEALEQIDLHRPDFVMTDILMPIMNGIELQVMLREHYPNIPCIVMSGYSDFEYVRESLRLGAKDYLTKPIVRKELYRILDKLKEQWLVAKEHLSAKETEDRHARERLHHHIFRGMLNGSISHTELELMEYAGLQMPLSRFCCLIAQLDRDSIEDERYFRVSPSLYSLYMSQFIRESLELYPYGYVLPVSDTKVVILLNYAADSSSYSQVLELAKRIGHDMKKVSSVTITIGVGSEVSEMEAISRSYEEADLAMLYRLISGGDRVLAYENVQRSRAIKTSTSFLDWSMLEKTLKNGDTEAVRTKTRKLVSKLCDATATPEIIQQQICKMLLHFYETAVNLNIVQEWLDGRDMKHVLEHILSITSKTELAHTCEELLGRLSDRQHRSSGFERPVDKVVRYVNEHFQEPLTLSKMAEMVYLNPSYLSTLFKNRIGVTFVDYVTERRIEEAKKLLLTTERKITDIAAVTGFANLRHFNRVFRAATNQTPGEYRGGDSQ